MKIAFYAGTLRYWGKLDPRSLNHDLPSPGGTELAMMNVAKALASIGVDIKVFADCEPGEYDGVAYYRTEMALPILTTYRHDVVVSWQDAAIFLYPLKTDLRVLMSQSAHLAMGQAADHIDRYFSVSRYSAGLLLDNDPYAHPHKMWITRNGVDRSRFASPRDVLHDRKHMLWASSPDRGLHHLLPIFRLVKQRVPDARLTVCYSFDKTYESYKRTQPGSTFLRFLDQANQLKDEPGVTFLQHVSQPTMSEMYQSAGILTYPCDPVRPTETYCNVVNEAMAAGMPAVISDADCLPENYGTAACVLPKPIDHEEWAEEIVRIMTDDARFTQLQNAGLELANLTDYRSVAKDWVRFFTEYLSGAESAPDRSLAYHIEHQD